MMRETITKALYKMSSDTTKILADQLKEHPDKFFDTRGNDSMLSVYTRRSNSWEWLLSNGTFPWYEKVLLKLVIRQAKIQLTKEKILETLVTGGEVSEEQQQLDKDSLTEYIKNVSIQNAVLSSTPTFTVRRANK
jgi:hypothetical protein